MYTHVCIYIYIYIHNTHVFMYSVLHAARQSFPAAESCANAGTTYTRLVSNSAATWSSRCCFTACHF